MTRQFRVALYCRQSSTEPDELDKSGSIEDQKTAGIELIERRNMILAGVYADVDAPWDRLDKRTDWLRLLDDAAAGNFEVVASVDTTRLWRSVEFKLHTCRTLAEAGVHTVMTKGGDTPTDSREDPEGGFVGTVLAAVAELDNQLRAMKVRQAHARGAREGRSWYGRRPFGWTVGRTEIVEREAELIREAYRRIVWRRERPGDLVRDWNERGITTTQGNAWTRSSLTAMLRSPALAGWRVHHGKRHRGLWTPILTPEEHEQLLAELDRRKPQSGGPGKPRLLSSIGLLICGRCETKMVAGTSWQGNGRSVRIYRCPPKTHTPGACGRMAITMDRADDEVRDRVLSSIDPQSVARYIEAAASDDRRVAEASKTLASIEERRRMVGRLLVQDGDEDAARAALDELAAQEQRARAELERSTMRLDLLVAAAEDPWAWWQRADLFDRRSLLEIVCRRITIRPPTPGVRWDPNRIVITWRA